MSPANSRRDARTPMLPVIDRGFAHISCAAVAIQYPPDAPASLMTAVVGFFAVLIACAIS